MSNNLEHGSSSSKRPSSSLFLPPSSYNRFHSQHPNPTTSRNNPEHGDGSNSSKPSSLFFTLSSYSRFRASRSRRIPSSSSSSDSIRYSLHEISSAVENSQLPTSPPSSDSIRYSLRDISSAVENSHLPTSDPFPYSLSEISSAVENSQLPTSLFFTLSSYSRFRASRSRRIPSSSSSSDSIRYSLREISSAVENSHLPTSDSIRYSLHEISSAVENSQLPTSDPIPYSRRDISSAVENSQLPTSDPIPYSLSEISSAVENSPSSIPLGRCSIKRCTLRNEKVLIFCVDHIGFQSPDLFLSHLSTLTSRSHHPSLVKLLGASQSQDPRHVYMVYEDISGTTLKKCLQTSNSNLLSNWIRRMQVALDLAQGLLYIHRHCGMVHNMITSSTVIVTKPNSNASICLFGANDFRRGQIEGTMGYAASELLKGGNISQKSDVYAFGVVILELISGKAAWEREEDRHKDVLTVEKARHAICREEGEREDEEIRRGRVMQFVDWKLQGSFPMETAESLIKVALKCVEDVPGLRPEMASVAEDIRRLFLHSKACLEVPPAEEDYGVSHHPRPEMASVAEDIPRLEATAEEEYEVSGEDYVASERFLSPR